MLGKGCREVIVDAQIHPYAANTPDRPWVVAEPGGAHLPEVTGEQMIAAMDAVGVDAGIIVSPVLVYGFDSSYAETVYQQYPDRFRLVTPVKPISSRTEQRLEQWAATPGAVGIRIPFETGSDVAADHPGLLQTVAAGIAHDLTINMQCWERLDIVDLLASRFPEGRFVLDHLGMVQPIAPPVPTDPFHELDQVLDLAKYPNVTVKVTGAGTVSHEPYPYKDLWDPVGRIIDSYGIERCMWGSDWTRATPFLTYEQGVSAFRDDWPISESEKAALLGENAVRVYAWDKF